MPENKKPEPEREEGRVHDRDLEKVSGGTAQDLSQAHAEKPVLPRGIGSN